MKTKNRHATQMKKATKDLRFVSLPEVQFSVAMPELLNENMAVPLQCSSGKKYPPPTDVFDYFGF